MEKTTNKQILQGLGELLGVKEKFWVKKNLRNDTIFMLKNYLTVYTEDASCDK